MGNPGMDVSKKNSNGKPAGIAELFSLLGTDSKDNIRILTEQACRMINATGALYRRIDENEPSLYIRSAFNLPDIEVQKGGSNGSICWEETIKKPGRAIILTDLAQTPYCQTDPYVVQNAFISYLGFPVLIDDRIIGSVCVFSKKKRSFSSEDETVIQVIADAISLEEKRLAESEKYKALIENANDAIYIIQDGTFKFTNSRVAELTGYSPEELSDLHFSVLVHPDDRDLLFSNHLRRLKGEKIPSTYDFRIIDKTGRTIWVQISAVRVLWENRPAVLGYLRDIRRIKELENKLIRSEKMELIGTMAGGVAHDLNNILSGLVSYPELILMQLGPGSPLKEPISFMHDAGMKAADIVQDLLTLTRRNIKIENIINLNNIVHEYYKGPAHRRLEKNYPDIRFTADCEADLLNICGSSSHISKIIMNLVINAAEAIKTTGTVHIATFNQYIDVPLSGYDDIEEGDYAVLRVTDNGDGISPEDLHRIFEPFYTKKQMGRSGTGLGLSVVWNCVKDHNGYIETRSQENKGTVFELYFPATRETLGNETNDFNVDHFRGSNQTILIVDDVEEQRRIARETLKHLGYIPFSVASGEKAIAYLEKNTVDLILLDMRMEPGIDGLETYQQILKIHPEQKAIIASGFSANERVRQALALGAGQYIKKPYTLKKLAHALKKELP